jgi:hypothetical protein
MPKDQNTFGEDNFLQNIRALKRLTRRMRVLGQRITQEDLANLEKLIKELYQEVKTWDKNRDT